MDDASAFALMRRFGKAYFSKDPGLLAQVLTEDAQWHFAIGPDAPNGRVRKGVAGFLQGIAENDALFETLRFEEIVFTGLADDRILMTYRVDGRHRGGDTFTLRGVELITVRGGRIAMKDVFWKQFRAD